MPAVLPAGDIELRRWDRTRLDELMDAIARSFEEIRHWLPWATEMPTRDAEHAVLEEGERRFDAGEDFGFFMHEVTSGELVGGCGGILLVWEINRYL
jgi:hypothetical protein